MHPLPDQRQRPKNSSTGVATAASASTTDNARKVLGGSPQRGKEKGMASRVSSQNRLARPFSPQYNSYPNTPVSTSRCLFSSGRPPFATRRFREARQSLQQTQQSPVLPECISQKAPKQIWDHLVLIRFGAPPIPISPVPSTRPNASFANQVSGLVNMLSGYCSSTC